jgi:hypothetical protein
LKIFPNQILKISPPNLCDIFQNLILMILMISGVTDFDHSESCGWQCDINDESKLCTIGVDSGPSESDDSGTAGGTAVEDKPSWTLVADTGSSGLSVWEPVEPPVHLHTDPMIFTARQKTMEINGLFNDWQCMSYLAQTPFTPPGGEISLFEEYAGGIWNGIEDHSVRARPGRLSSLSVPHSGSVLYSACAWARRALNGPNRRFRARPKFRADGGELLLGPVEFLHRSGPARGV